MTVTGLQNTYDSELSPSKLSFGTTAPTSLTYCVQSTVGGKTWSKNGPGASISNAACP
jgi:hypothetical protein